MTPFVAWISFLVILALFFDFLNGFHDAANSIATVVATRVLSPKIAVWWAAFFNFVAFLFFGTLVAKTVGKGIVELHVVDSFLICGALIGACVWNIITWYLGLPTSSSHALIGGLIGAALVKAGPAALVRAGIIKTVAFIVVSPVMGFVLSTLIGLAVFRLLQYKNPHKIDHIFRKGQLVSAALYSLGHGGNDAQKTMGIITGLLFSANMLHGAFHVPPWVMIICNAAIALGTLSGGWRIVKTMGNKITRLRPVDGFCAESGSAISLFFASWLGVPVSTTHTITGGIVGVGMLRRMSAVRWGVASRIVWAWVFTIPAAAVVAGIAYYFVQYLHKMF